jgi:cytoskeletal protein CcmA (bactofilin family)
MGEGMKFKKDNPDEILSILAEGVDLDGVLTFSHGVRIDGAVRGKLNSDACLVIGIKGKVEAEISVRRVSISGEFRGKIRASDRVEIHKEGRVFGDIYTPCLIIEAGALFEGKCNMNDKQTGPMQEATKNKIQTGGETGNRD